MQQKHFIWLPNIRRKDRSLARYPEFAAYKSHTKLMLIEAHHALYPRIPPLSIFSSKSASVPSHTEASG
jgi:hypothetical protein